MAGEGIEKEEERGSKEMVRRVVDMAAERLKGKVRVVMNHATREGEEERLCA